MRETRAIVESNDLTTAASGRRYGHLRVRIGEQLSILPGQFAMLRAEVVLEPLLRRAMAFYRVEQRADDMAAEFIYQIVGRGTESFSRLLPGDGLSILGPLGNPFDLSASAGREALLVAGGAGSPALYLLAKKLIQLGVPTRLFLGGASRGDLCGLDQFTILLGKENVVTATIDGSSGVTGYVTQPLESALQNGSGRELVYACGPDPMLHRLAQIVETSRTPAQLSLEAPMACGFGICVGCAVPVRSDCPEGFVYQKVCTDGPVFWSHDLVWN